MDGWMDGWIERERDQSSVLHHSRTQQSNNVCIIAKIDEATSNNCILNKPLVLFNGLFDGRVVL
jgi:hypothetical protein